MKVFLKTLTMSIALASSFYANANEEADKAAKELANPNTALASLNFKNQFTEYNDGTTSMVTVFQPTLPFPREDGSKIIFRPALPIIWDNERADESGIGDLAFDFAYAVPTKDPSTLMAFGIAGSLPTASDDKFGGETTAFGPEFLYGKLSKSYIWGLFPSHLWDVSGDIKVNKTSSQFFSVWLPGGGWNYGTSPTVSFDHETDQWTVPLNVNVGKTVMWDGSPWKLSVEFNYYVESDDDFGQDWMIGINISPVVNNALTDWFK